jgi:hypothetical protein
MKLLYNKYLTVVNPSNYDEAVRGTPEGCFSSAYSLRFPDVQL